MLGRVEQYSFTRPSSIKLQCRLGKFRNNVEKGEWVLFSNTSLSHKLRILLQKPHYPIQVKVDQIEHWRLIHMGRFLTEYEETERLFWQKSIQNNFQVEVHIMGSTWISIMNVAWFILAFEFINCPSKVTLTWHVNGPALDNAFVNHP